MCSTGDLSTVKDVWDGEVLKKATPTTTDIALSLCTDGVPIFKSSRVTMWPVYLAILNLPPSKIYKSQNIILCSLWVGPGKPPMEHFLKPLTERMSRLSSTGVKMKMTSGYVTVKAKLVLAVFDLPAKAAVLNCKQYNGKYGCHVCLNPGFQEGRSGAVRRLSGLIQVATESHII